MSVTVTYFVWRRSDGYVSATTYDPSRMRHPNHTFEVLGSSTDWDVAARLLVAERATGWERWAVGVDNRA